VPIGFSKNGRSSSCVPYSAAVVIVWLLMLGSCISGKLPSGGNSKMKLFDEVLFAVFDFWLLSFEKVMALVSLLLVVVVAVLSSYSPVLLSEEFVLVGKYKLSVLLLYMNRLCVSQ
jgi:hypothetical protein